MSNQFSDELAHLLTKKRIFTCETSIKWIKIAGSLDQTNAVLCLNDKYYRGNHGNN